jgi:D-3-phosphoglycerate dehydrogenase
MLGGAAFATMQPHAYYITTARGGIHDEAALAEALAKKQIAGAGLDVWEDEPPPTDHPLMQFDNVLVSPHTAALSVRENERIVDLLVTNLRRFRRGEPLVNVVDVEHFY